MSYQTAKRQDLLDKQWIFSGGFVDNCENLDLSPHYSPYLRNARLEWQSVIIRPWHSLFVDLEPWSYPKWIWSYLNTSWDKIVLRHNIDSTHKLYTLWEDWTLTDIDTSTNISSDNRMNFQNVGNVIYCMNGSDWFGKLSWTTYTKPASVPSNFAPAYSVIFNSSHWASWWSTNPNTVYKSVWDNYDDFTNTWSDQFTFEEAITWLCANNESLFYFTKNSISVTWQSDLLDNAGTITYATRKLQTKEWAMNHNTIVAAGNNIYYLTSSNAINMIARWNNIYWFEVVDMSERKYQGISKIMSTLDNDQSSAWWYFLPKEMLIKWFVRSSWSTINDICIIYDITKDKFLVDEQKYFYDGIYFKGYNYTLSQIEPKVYLDEYWQDDEDSPIQFEYRTKEFYISEPTTKKVFRETRTLLDITPITSVTQEIYIDWLSADIKTLTWSWLEPQWIWDEEIWDYAIWDEWDDDIEYSEMYILRTKWNLNKVWRKIQRRFTCWALAWKVRLKNIALKAEIKPEIASNLTP